MAYSIERDVADLCKFHVLQACGILSGNSDDLAAAKIGYSSHFIENSIKKNLFNVSGIPGKFKTIDSKKKHDESSFPFVEENSESNGSLCFDDSDFYPSDVAREMLQKDQEQDAKRNLTMADLNCYSDSSWSVVSVKDASVLSQYLDLDSDQSKKRVSVGEFIKARTERLGALSDDPFRQRPYFGSDVSTPKPRDKILCSTPLTASVNFLGDDCAKQSNSSKIEQETLSSLPILWNVPLKRESLTKEGILEEFHLILGIEQHGIEDRNSACNENIKWTDKTSRNEKIYDGSSGFSNCDTICAQMEETVISSQDFFQSDDASSNQQTFPRQESAIEYWMIQPQELTIDVNTKGSRLLLINNSVQDLKFKTKFDGTVINVCPLSGILPAKKQIRLRILVSPILRRKNENCEDIMKIMCGKTEKNVIIKVCKEEKAAPTVKDRSYVCF